MPTWTWKMVAFFAVFALQLGQTQAQSTGYEPSKCLPGSAHSCGEGEFCELPAGSCQPHSGGLCQSVPETCDHTYRPVCGCDGHTYPNRCIARLFGVSIRSRGECPQPTTPDNEYEQNELGTSESDYQVLKLWRSLGIGISDLYFCYGWDEDTHQCHLYLGSKQLCDTVQSCW